MPRNAILRSLSQVGENIRNASHRALIGGKNLDANAVRKDFFAEIDAQAAVLYATAVFSRTRVIKRLVLAVKHIFGVAASYPIALLTEKCVSGGFDFGIFRLARTDKGLHFKAVSVRGKAIRLIKRFREVGSVAEFEFSEILGFFIYNVHIYFRAVSKQFGRLFAVKRGGLEALRKHADAAVCADNIDRDRLALDVADDLVIAI